MPRGAETVWRYADGPAAGGPAITRHTLGSGRAWYVFTRLSSADLDQVLALACHDARIRDRDDIPRDVEVVHRDGEHGSYLFALNHTGGEAKVPLEHPGTELLTGERAVGRLCVPAGGVRVLRLDS